MVDQLRDRQDTAIWNAIEANNIKQALKLVDKRLAKKHTEYLEVREQAQAIHSIILRQPPKLPSNFHVFHVIIMVLFSMRLISCQALKIYIRSRSSQIAEKSAVLIHLEELAGRKPALSDFDAIELYDEALGEILLDSHESWGKIIGELRWQCVKSAPKNEDASLKCFQACLSMDDLDHARQVKLLL